MQIIFCFYFSQPSSIEISFSKFSKLNDILNDKCNDNMIWISLNWERKLYYMQMSLLCALLALATENKIIIS